MKCDVNNNTNEKNNNEEVTYGGIFKNAGNKEYIENLIKEIESRNGDKDYAKELKRLKKIFEDIANENGSR